MADERTTKKLTQPRRELLAELVKNGGTIRGKHLSTPTRILASRAQADRLVRWERPIGQHGTNLDNWLLHITDVGEDALNGK